jgi:hypothetical protein
MSSDLLSFLIDPSKYQINKPYPGRMVFINRLVENILMNRRRFKRFREHCDVDFVADGKLFPGTSGDFALNGLFIMTRDAKAPGTIIDIAIHLPNGAISKLRGKVRRFFRTVTGQIKDRSDGMGIEILDKDESYLHFIRSLLVETEKDLHSQAAQIAEQFAQQHHGEMLEKGPGENEKKQPCLPDRLQPLIGWGSSREERRVLTGPENKKKNEKSLDDTLLEHISKRLNR